MSKSRTFIAIAISKEMRQYAKQAIGILRPTTENINWVAPENLHWTLQFLGEVEDTELHAVCRSISKAAAEFEAFTLSSAGVGAFPSIDQPRTIWLGATEGGEQLIKLQDKIEGNMADLGFHPDRRTFTPHLTLGRVSSGRDGGTQLAERLAKMTNFEGGVTTVDQVTVFSTEPSRDGPTYHVTSRAPLA